MSSVNESVTQAKRGKVVNLLHPDLITTKKFEIFWRSELNFRYKDEDLQRDEHGELKMRPADVPDGVDPYDEPIPKDGAIAVNHYTWSAAWKASIRFAQYGAYMIVSFHEVGQATEPWEVTEAQRYEVEKLLMNQYQDTYKKITEC